MMTLHQIRDVLRAFNSTHWYRPSVGHHIDNQLRLWEGVIPGLRRTTADHLVYEDDPLLAISIHRDDLNTSGAADELGAMDVTPLVVVASYAGMPVLGLHGLEVIGEGIIGVNPLDSTMHFVIALEEGGDIDVRATTAFADLVSSIDGTPSNDPFDLFCHLGIVIEPDGEERAHADLYRQSIVEIEAEGAFVAAQPRTSEAPAFVITAYNPGSDRPTHEENEAAMSRLLAAIERLATHVPPEGTEVTVTRARGSSFDRIHSEPSWAVAGIGRSAARALGRDFGQVAIFEIGSNGIHVIGCFRDWRIPLGTEG